MIKKKARFVIKKGFFCSATVFFAGILILAAVLLLPAPSYAVDPYRYEDVYIYVQGNYIFENKEKYPYDKIDPVIVDFLNKGGNVNWGMFFAWFTEYGEGLYPTSGDKLCQAKDGNYWLSIPSACESVQSLEKIGFTIGGNGGGWGKVPIGADESVDDAMALVNSVITKLTDPKTGKTAVDRLDFDLEDYPMMWHPGGIKGPGYSAKEWEKYFGLLMEVKKSVPGLRFTLTVSVASKYHWETSKGYEGLVRSQLLSREDNPFDMVFLMCMADRPGDAYVYSYLFKYSVRELGLENMLEKGCVIPVLDYWTDPNFNPNSKKEIFKLNETCALLQDENETHPVVPEMAGDQAERTWEDLKGVSFKNIAFFTGDDADFSLLKDILRRICSE
ncbi:MAG: hypothetical protein JXB40_01765 [Candidatus Omnitrophica bacterium]|nr:hypothetical protein [Candidatus Omnitrophota bacterium]